MTYPGVSWGTGKGGVNKGLGVGKGRAIRRAETLTVVEGGDEENSQSEGKKNVQHQDVRRWGESS